MSLMLKFVETDNGFCRVYYRDQDRRLLCFQLSTKTEFELLRCSKDGEPSHVIPHAGATIDRMPEDDSTTARELCQWLATQKDILCETPVSPQPPAAPKP